MSIFFRILILLGLNLFVNASEIRHIDLNSSIERLDDGKWDPLYYQYKLIDNIPYQYDKKNKSYFFNPIYGAYFLMNYSLKYKDTKNFKYLEYSKILIASLLNKVEKINYKNKESYVFYYESNELATRLFHRHYSGLTQSYYISNLAELYNLTKDEYFKELALKFFNSLLIPIEDGGVLFDKEGYTALEETPLYPNQFILNGWLSAIVSLDKANEILKDDAIQNLINKNINTLNLIIDKFDVESLNNSRYCLTHFFWFRLLQKNYSIKSIKFEYPLNQLIEITSTKNIDNKNKSRWETFIKNDNLDLSTGSIVGKNELQFNGVLSNMGANKVIIEYEKPINKEDVEFQIYLGEYSPMAAGTLNNKWESIDKSFLKIDNNKLIIDIQHNKLNEVIGYPTNFLKKFTNGHYNAYHDIHIKWINYLGQKYNSEKLKFYANKWLKYRENWKKDEPYKKLFDDGKIIINDMFLIDK